jgi:hypothetical protein
MGKSDAELIALFNEQVNMSADELETWLDDPQSRKAGTGVGIESGRRIVEILRKNPSKSPDGYDEVGTRARAFFFLSFPFCPSASDTTLSRKTWRISGKWSGEFLSLRGVLCGSRRGLTYLHIRSSYNGRHLAQEDHLKETKTVEELEKAKSTIRQVSRFHFRARTDPAAVSRIGVMCVLNDQLAWVETESFSRTL